MASAAAGYTLFVNAPQKLSAAPADSIARRKADFNDAFSGKFEDDPLMDKTKLSCDLLVVGGGLAGVCSAISAARHGAKVILLQDRSRLGGNASSEIRMHPLGVHSQSVGWREGGIMEELRLENAVRNPTFSWEVWDLLLYDKCVSEKNITLYLDTDAYKAEAKNGRITRVWARSDSTRNVYEIEPKMVADCSGDSRVALSAGAEYFSGREGSKLYGESLADYDKVGTRQGSSLMFTSVEAPRPVPFVAPKWAKKITPEMLKYRRPSDVAYGMWWIELGGVYDAIKDAELLRFELLAIVLGVWDYIKNSGKFKGVENRVLSSIGMLPGRRDTFRIKGDYVMKQNDIEGGWRNFDDAVAVGGWTMDDHPAEGFYAFDRRPCKQTKIPSPYNIPFSSLYSSNIENLMMAGRNISCSHVAFTSTRVMATCAAMGQALGTAAATCAALGITPRQLRKNPTRLKVLQQTLLADDQTILGVADTTPNLAKSAKISASDSAGGSKPENVVSGVNIDSPKTNNNRWVAPCGSRGAWISFEFDAPQKVSEVALVFESGWNILTQSGETVRLKNMIAGAQPTVVKDYKIIGTNGKGEKTVLADVKGNYLKTRKHRFAAGKFAEIALEISATNGSADAIVKSVKIS